LECSGSREFGFQELAHDMSDATDAVQGCRRAYEAPVGADVLPSARKGRFQATPEEILKLALAGLEKKKRVQETIAAWTQSLARYTVRQKIAVLREELLYAPDRAKAKPRPSAGCKDTGLTPAQLLRALRPAARPA